MGYEKYFFSHARTAFKYGLINFNFSEDDEILMPKYICDSIIRPLEFLKIKPIYYKINRDFKPNWNDIYSKYNKKTRAIVAVHFFGKPQDLEKFVDFKLQNNILLIEDNAHGWGSSYKEKLLGEIGDFGFSSPRKIINIKTGAILYINKKISVRKINLKSTKDPLNCWKYWDITKKFIKSKPYIYKLIKSQPKYWDSEVFREGDIDNLLIDKYSLKVILKTNLDQLKKQRQLIYKIWENFVQRKTDLKPVFNKLSLETSPYVFPAYTKSAKESKKYFDWGWKNGFEITSWPTFPEQTKNDIDVKSIWKNLICFPINQSIDPYKLENRLEKLNIKGNFNEH